MKRAWMIAALATACSSGGGTETKDTKGAAKAAAKADAKTPAKAETPEAKPAAPPDAKAPPSAEPRADAGARTWSFDDATAPADLRVLETNGVGTPATWAVVPRDDAPSPPNAYGITSTANTGQTYNFVLFPGATWRDVDIQVMVLPVSGQGDRGGGVVLRAKDERNYYIARWNPVEKNVAAYVVLDGVRSNLAKVPIDLPEDAWHELRVIMEGTTLRCLLDDEPVLTVEDDKLGEAGAIGLWTKADAATLFDDLSVGPP